jgi:hypothetical protein
MNSATDLLSIKAISAVISSAPSLATDPQRYDEGPVRMITSTWVITVHETLVPIGVEEPEGPKGVEEPECPDAA